MKKFDSINFIFAVFFLLIFVYLLVLPSSMLLRILLVFGIMIYSLIIYAEMKPLKKKVVKRWSLLSDVKYARKKWKKAR